MRTKIKRKKNFKIKYIIIIIVIILLFIGTSYSLLTSTLNINGNIDAIFDYPLEPVANGNNYSSNTGFSATVLLIATRNLFEFVQDVRENDMLTTQIRNRDKFTLTPGTNNTTFTINIKNTGPVELTNGRVTVTDGSDANMNPGTYNLGSTTLAPDGTTTFSATIAFSLRSTVATNSYITYTISYDYNNLTISYNYRVLVVS